METKHTIKKFDEAINVRLRNLYLESLGAIVTYPGKPPRPRVRRHEQWKKIKPHGRHNWDPIKNNFANSYDPIDVTARNDVWVWSDLHFGHKNIIRYSDRPFNSTEEMNEMLIEEFNNHVKPEDISIWVGDVAFYPDDKANGILHQCNGYKILVIGNHDFNKRELKKLHFDEIHIVYNLTFNDRVVAFTHYPMDNLPKGWFNIHGHVHKGKADPAASNRHVNVNCEFIDYKPINLNELIDRIETLAIQPEQVQLNVQDEYD